jgi:conjugative transfer signal peptidase TraF
VLLVAGVALALRLRVNLTGSVPLGLYQLRPVQELVPGDLVVACLPHELAEVGRARHYLGAGGCPGGVTPILKPVFALPGDTLVVRREGVERNGDLSPGSVPLLADRSGRALMPRFGREVVPPGAVWVLSTHDPASWDSRYFGPLQLSSISDTARPVWVFR